MTDLARIENAIRKAHEAGNAEHVKALGEEYRRLKAESKPEQPSPDEARFSGVTQEDVWRASLPGRAIAGLTDPIIGSFQLGANAGDWIYGKLNDDPNRSSLSEDVNQWVRDREESYERGRRAYGEEGDFDLARLVGQGVVGGAATKGVNSLKSAAQAGATVGASMPVTDDNFAETKAFQAVSGAVLGGALQPVTSKIGSVGKWAYDKYAPLFEGAAKTAGRAIRSQLGDKADDVAALLRKDINPFTKGSAAEVAAPAQSARFSALQSAVDEMLPDEAYARERAQREAHRAALGEIADLEDPARAFRDRVSKAMREDALASANQNTAKAAQLAKQLQQADDRVTSNVRNRYATEGEKAYAQAKASNYTPVKGVPRAPSRYAPHQRVLETADEFIDDARVLENLSKAERDTLTMQANAMREYGIEGLTPNNIVSGIGKVLASSKKGNPDVVRTLKQARNYIQKEMVEPDGSINADALYLFRKTGLEKMIQRAMGKDGAARQSEVSALAKEVRPLLDEAIEAASGGGWKKYIKAYAKLSRPVDQGRVGRTLLKSYDKNLSEGRVSPAGLANALEDATGTLKKSGVTGSSIDDVMKPRQRAMLGALKKDVARTDEVRIMANKGRGTRGDAFKAEDKTLANPLMREIMVSNAIIRAVSKRQQEKVATEISRLMQRDPQAGFRVLADAIENAGPTNRAWVENLAKGYGITTRVAGGASAATIAGQIGQE